MHFSRVVSLERQLKGVILSISSQLLLAIVKTSTFFQIFLGKHVKRKYVFIHSSTYHTHILNFKNTRYTLYQFFTHLRPLLSFLIISCAVYNQVL